MFILGDFQCELADKNKHQNMDFLSLFMSKWDEIHDKSDVFRYKIDKIREKVVSGYLLQVQRLWTSYCKVLVSSSCISSMSEKRTGSKVK